MRDWVRRLSSDFTGSAFHDWDPYCRSPDGVFVTTAFEDRDVVLPAALDELRERLRDFVPDEDAMHRHESVFNGPRYCLVRVERELRRSGERAGCHLIFCRSDYRTFLATNGMSAAWADRLGLTGTEWRGEQEWVARWRAYPGSDSFFRNSFGINVLCTIDNREGQRRALFLRRHKQLAFGGGWTIGTVDEGLRRSHAGSNTLFDERSRTDPSPNLVGAVWRGLKEEIGITRISVPGVAPVIMSVGEVRSFAQPAALVHLHLPMSIEEIREAHAYAPDGSLESFEGSTPIDVALTQEALVRFFVDSESNFPVTSWTAAMSALAMRSSRYKSVFISYSYEEADFALALKDSLEEGGVRCWMDRADARGGDALPAALQAGVESADVFVVCCTSQAARSPWVRQELRHAKHHGKQIVPVKLDEGYDAWLSDPDLGVKDIVPIEARVGDVSERVDAVFRQLRTVLLRKT